jgi:hypothetical protein
LSLCVHNRKRKTDIKRKRVKLCTYETERYRKIDRKIKRERKKKEDGKGRGKRERQSK